MATRRILIDPVTRIEGHAKISIHLDDRGEVADARFHVTEFRGFETFCQGRLLWEMPALCARVCGICPISHLLASSKAGDAILGVQIPPAAVKLRRLANLAQIVQSHALSFFHPPADTPGVTRVETVVNWPSANSTSATDSRTAMTRDGRARHTAVRPQDTLSRAIKDYARARTGQNDR